MFFDLVDDVADGRLSSIEHAVVAVFHIIHGMSRAMEGNLRKSKIVEYIFLEQLLFSLDHFHVVPSRHDLHMFFVPYIWQCVMYKVNIDVMAVVYVKDGVVL